MNRTFDIQTTIFCSFLKIFSSDFPEKSMKGELLQGFPYLGMGGESPYWGGWGESPPLAENLLIPPLQGKLPQ